MALINLISLLVLLISATTGSRLFAHRFSNHQELNRSQSVLTWGTLSVAWCIGIGLCLGYVAEWTQEPWVTMPLIAAGSCILWVVTYLIPSASRVRNRARPTSIHWGAFFRKHGFCIIPAGLLYGGLWVEGMLRPPRSFDGLFYHIPMMRRWLEEGRLSMLPDKMRHCMPSNCELWQTYFASLRVEPLIELSLLPIGGLLAWTLYVLARQFGAHRPGALTATCIGLSVPMVALQSFSAYVDMFGATFVLGTLFWGVRFLQLRLLQKPCRLESVLIGLNIGLAIGTKLTLMGWIVMIIGLLWVVFVVQILRNPILRRQGRFNGLVSHLGIILAATIFCCGFWFFRNAYQTGWPLYPLQFRLAGHAWGSGGLSPEVLDAESPLEGWQRVLTYPWREVKLSGYPYSVDNGLGPAYAAFVVVGTLYFLLRPNRRRRSSKKNNDRDDSNRLNAEPLPAVLRNFWISNQRWLMFLFLVAGSILQVKALGSMPRLCLPLWLTMIAVTALMLDSFLRYLPRMSRILLFLCLTLSASMIGLWPAKTLVGRIADRNLSRSYAYGLPAKIDQLPSGTRLLHLCGGAMNYPLMGENWNNIVLNAIVAPDEDYSLPLSKSLLEQYNVEVVYACGTESNIFGPDVSYQSLVENSSTQIFRIIKK